MFKGIFTWLYCLDIPWVCVLAAAGTGLLCILNVRCKGFKVWRVILAVLFSCWFLSVLWLTVLSRQGGSQPVLELTLFQSYIDVANGGNRELLRSNFMNVLLFYPAGVLLTFLLPESRKNWQIMLGIGLFALLLSAGIEWFQWVLACGQVQADDVFHNTLGAFIGALAISQLSDRKKRAEYKN